MKRTPLKRSSKPMKRTRLNLVGHSTTAQDKQEIQRLVRLIITLRDGGCILRKVRCGVEATVEDEQVISSSVIQADHLVTRSNSATFADTRLIVCLCRDCHGWKHWHEKEYDNLVRCLIPIGRVKLWDMAEAHRQAHITCKVDWKLAIIVLKMELRKLTR